jgi:hypothetical protein
MDLALYSAIINIGITMVIKALVLKKLNIGAI